MMAEGVTTVWSKNECQVTWLVGGESGVQGSREQTARRPARSLTHSSASSQPAEKIHPLKLVDGAGVEYLFLEV